VYFAGIGFGHVGRTKITVHGVKFIGLFEGLSGFSRMTLPNGACAICRYAEVFLAG
jgi:hypothetical protein